MSKSNYFSLKKFKKTINYKLNLFKNVKIYSIFYISLVKSIDFNTFIQKTFHYTIQKKTNSKSKKFYDNKIKSILWNEKNTLYRKTYKKI